MATSATPMAIAMTTAQRSHSWSTAVINALDCCGVIASRVA